MQIKVLGSAAGGGFPQWNCGCANCRLAWNGDSRVKPRTQSSLAISADGISWLLLNASPDLRQQILATPALHPSEAGRSSPIRGVVLTNGDVDHVAGLLVLRESQAFDLFASPFILAELAKNTLFGVLNPDLVKQHKIHVDADFSPVDGLRIKAIAVPGKVPLYAEAANIAIGEESETTIGLEIRSGNARAYYIPGCARLTDGLRQRIAGADLLLFDGTTFTDDEMVAQHLSSKTAWRMGHIAMSGAQGSLAGWAQVPVAAKVFIHINNTNPVLVEGSSARRSVEAAGWQIAEDGMEIDL
ncbi:MAG: pyrroloquinoline quinone biosynthesis protein PqqB [Hyphomicrobiales bacterium]|nr:pyrroloquinoline quinone biosynthesis protein PqqB [Hyphomicrobiales bacterium]MDE2115528.1 pyrroloquinoline quinone biosynthesis protein PqqB [Hyphomicrobiales bacterium]